MPPLYLELSLTRKCNLDCLFCGRREVDKEVKNSEEHLSKEEFIEIVEQAGRLGVKKLHIGCQIGEPSLTTEKTISVMETAKKFDMVGSIVTNGTEFTESDLEKLIDLEWNSIIFSLYSTVPELHDEITNTEGSFRKSIMNIAKLIDRKHDRGKKEPRVSLAFVPTKKNYKQLGEFVRLASDLGADEILVEPMIVYHEIGEELSLSDSQKSEFEDVLEEASILAEKLDIDGNFVEIKESIAEQPNCSYKPSDQEKDQIKSRDFFSMYCFSPWLKMCVSSEGAVNPCPSLWEKKGVNWRKSSLKEIWEGDYFKRYRQKIKRGDLPKDCEEYCVPLYLEMSREPKKELERIKGIKLKGK